MELMFSESDKRIIKWGLWLIRTKLGESASAANIHNDMINCGNAAIKSLALIVDEAAKNIKSKHQRDVVSQLSELGLWVCYKDTAYRDIFFWILNEALKNPEEFKKMIKPYVKKPEKWHVNIWVDSKDFTKEGKKKGTVPLNTISFAESVHVRKVQGERLRKMLFNK